MTIKLRPNPKQLRDLIEIANIGGESLADLASDFEDLSPVPLLPDQLEAVIRQKLPDQNPELLLSQLLSLGMLIRRSDSKSQDIMLALRELFEAENVSKWDDVATQFQSLVESKPVRMVVKSMELSYDYANLLRDIRIVTDLRPFFDDDGKGVEAGVVSHTLRIHYTNEDVRHELSLALDLQDISKLRDQCERAVFKAHSIRDEFATSTGKPCMISGEEGKKEQS